MSQVAPWSTLSCQSHPVLHIPTQEVFTLLDYTRLRLHMSEALERFAWITITGMLLCLIQKCLSKPTVNPQLPTPTFSHAKIKWSNFPISRSFFPGVSWTYQIKLEASVFNLYSKQKITAHTLRVCQCSLQVFCVVIFSLAVGSIFWGALKRCDKVGAGW